MNVNKSELVIFSCSYFVRKIMSTKLLNNAPYRAIGRYTNLGKWGGGGSNMYVNKEQNWVN